MAVTAFFFEFEKHLNLCIIGFKAWDFYFSGELLDWPEYGPEFSCSES